MIRAAARLAAPALLLLLWLEAPVCAQPPGVPSGLPKQRYKVKPSHRPTPGISG
jgi:hypothetical protein